MKTQKLSFLKLLCFKNKFNLLVLDVTCVFVAILLSCILLEYAVVAPSKDIIDVCEIALYEYLENPSDYSPLANVSIILDENTVIATVPQAFTYLVATRNENQTYQITTHICFATFLFSYFLSFIFRVAFLYITIEVLLYNLINMGNFFLKMLQKFKLYISKKIKKIKIELERKNKQKELKEYENPRLQEIYQLGYNMGRADGIAEGIKMSKSDLSYQT